MAKKTIEIVHEESGRIAEVFPSSLNVYKRHGWKKLSKANKKKAEENEEVEGQYELPVEPDSTERDNSNRTSDNPIQGSEN